MSAQTSTITGKPTPSVKAMAKHIAKEYPEIEQRFSVGGLEMLISVLKMDLERNAFSLAVAAERLGKSPDTLKRWEKDYGGVYTLRKNPRGEYAMSRRQLELIELVEGGVLSQEMANEQWQAYLDANKQIIPDHLPNRRRKRK